MASANLGNLHLLSLEFIWLFEDHGRKYLAVDVPLTFKNSSQKAVRPLKPTNVCVSRQGPHADGGTLVYATQRRKDSQVRGGGGGGCRTVAIIDCPALPEASGGFDHKLEVFMVAAVSLTPCPFLSALPLPVQGSQDPGWPAPCRRQNQFSARKKDWRPNSPKAPRPALHQACHSLVTTTELSQWHHPSLLCPLPSIPCKIHMSVSFGHQGHWMTDWRRRLDELLGLRALMRKCLRAVIMRERCALLSLDGSYQTVHGSYLRIFWRRPLRARTGLACSATMQETIDLICLTASCKV